MKTKKITTIVAVILFLSLIAFLFYWYEWRPSYIKETCGNETAEKMRQQGNTIDINTGTKLYDLYYESCLHKHGL